MQSFQLPWRRTCFMLSSLLGWEIFKTSSQFQEHGVAQSETSWFFLCISHSCQQQDALASETDCDKDSCINKGKTVIMGTRCVLLPEVTQWPELRSWTEINRKRVTCNGSGKWPFKPRTLKAGKSKSFICLMFCDSLNILIKLQVIYLISSENHNESPLLKKALWMADGLENTQQAHWWIRKLLTLE